jgi:hypothetical protein
MKMDDLLRMLCLLGIVIVVCGMLVHWYGWYCFFADAFEIGFLWGVGCLLLPPLIVIVLVQYWKRVRNSFAATIAGIGIVALGFLAMQVSFWR